MLSSLRMGVNQLPRSIEGVWIHPADLPLVTVETYQQLKTFCQGLGKDRTQRLIAPLFKGQKGHPVFFGAKYFPSFFQAPLQVGARWITKKYRDSLDLVEVDDQGILQDMDRPKDIEQYFSSP